NVLCIDRSFEGEEIIGIFNFSEFDKEVSLSGIEGEYKDMFTGRKMRPEKIMLSAYGFYYLSSVTKR
ncbi:MAG: alpha-glucosidase C-terminal domain-containing protein, partial [Lachnospiraceae bacterium]|nr:alpha-glucosidase C-terminal domain-containing protein [Lachnospiraceae bacterium]